MARVRTSPPLESRNDRNDCNDQSVRGRRSLSTSTTSTATTRRAPVSGTVPRPVASPPGVRVSATAPATPPTRLTSATVSYQTSRPRS